MIFLGVAGPGSGVPPDWLEGFDVVHAAHTYPANPNTMATNANTNRRLTTSVRNVLLWSRENFGKIFLARICFRTKKKTVATSPPSARGVETEAAISKILSIRPSCLCGQVRFNG